ncbi:MAG: Holliday junction resolvase RuvX [Xanthomonadales bacterium]
MPEAALPRGYILSFDYGLKRIGVAVGQATTGTATPLETVRHGREPDWDSIARLIRDWRPALALVGLPLGAEGDETPMSRAARAFGAALGERFAITVEFIDERLTSHAASARFVEQRASGALRRKHADRVDAIAAQIMLENYLQARG